MNCPDCHFAMHWKATGPFCSFPDIIWSEGRGLPPVCEETFSTTCKGENFVKAPRKRVYGYTLNPDGVKHGWKLNYDAEIGMTVDR